MEEERQRHIQARTKPTPRIGPAGESGLDDSKFQEYDLSKNTAYRVDGMGMDTSWRDYRAGDIKVPQKRHLLPKFKVERPRGKPGPNAPVETEDLMQGTQGTQRATPRGGAATPRGDAGSTSITPPADQGAAGSSGARQAGMPAVTINYRPTVPPSEAAASTMNYEAEHKPRWADQPRFVLPGQS